VELQEAENQIITHYEVYEERPSDQHLVLPALATPFQLFVRLDVAPGDLSGQF